MLVVLCATTANNTVQSTERGRADLRLYLYLEQIVLLVQSLVPILQVGVDPLQLGDDLLLILTAGASVKAEAAS